MILLLGPCMVMAPLVLLAIPVGIVLWPPALLLLGLAYLLLWPFAALAGGRGSRGIPALHARVGALFRTLLTPWNYFDAPADAPPAADAPDHEGPSGA